MLLVLGTTIGMYALALGRVPGRWLQRNVENPRVWGAGALLLVAAVFSSRTVALIGAGLITLGYLKKPTFDH
ncbi:hypothetical protein OHB05_28905 [Streptomyces sp. NBC_00638]|uniref:hypothetical protein n=1 Tax=Streptomyces sp. NBC_00638 TaxID=2975794 RepID=UPI002252A17C|nr:hypothetical protein [Streptomyces sp. NBC_00638]MCX5006610.1 hypothetical protein [Streptomyces sp. NBC_00638]